MGLLKSVDNVPGIDFYEYRDIPFYNKHTYKLRLEVFGVNHIYYCSNERDLRSRFTLKPTGPGYQKRVLPKDVREKGLANIEALAQLHKLYREKKKPYTMRIEAATIGFYSSDLSVLQDIEKQIGSQYKLDYTEAVTSEYAGTKQFVNEPKHKFRVYMKTRRLNNCDNIKTELAELFKRNKKLYPCPKMVEWTKELSTLPAAQHRWWYSNWSKASHFIDYDDESTLSYLALLYGELLGKKYKLEKRPDNV
jgi:hypothetical protein